MIKVLKLSLIALSIICYFSSSAQAEFQPKPITSSECRDLLEELSVSNSRFWEINQNIFSTSMDSTIFWGTTWLSAVQGGKHLLLGNAFFTPGFIITLPMDIGLTITSHFFSLESFTASDNLSPRQDFWLRSAFNTTMGSIFIPLVWSLFNVLHSYGWNDTKYAITPLTCLGAAGLCAVVYPTLQRSKNFLFKERPLARDRNRLEDIRKNFKELAEQIIQKSRKRGAELGFNTDAAEALSLSVLSSLITSYEYEDAIELIPELMRDSRVRRLVKKIENLDEQKNRKLSGLHSLSLRILKKDRDHQLVMKQMKWRRKLIDYLLELESQNHHSQIIRRLLYLGEAFTEEQSIEFHRALSQYSQEKRQEIFISSLLDQMLSVGIAGGLFLYGINTWAATGETPWFIQWLLE